jgi:hypothetical protein
MRGCQELRKKGWTDRADTAKVLDMAEKGVFQQ